MRDAYWNRLPGNSVHRPGTPGTARVRERRAIDFGTRACRDRGKQGAGTRRADLRCEIA